MFQDLNQIIDYILYNYLYWIHTRNEDNNMEHNPCSLATPPGIINTPNVWILFGHSDIIVGLQLTSQSLRSCHVVNSNKINNLLICQFNPSGDCGRTRSTILNFLPICLTELLLINFLFILGAKDIRCSEVWCSLFSSF